MLYNYSMGKRTNILLIVLICVLLYGFYYLAIPHIVHLDKLNPYICNYIEDNYGFKIEFTNPSFKMGYTPSIWIKADSFKIKNNDGTDALSVEKPVLEVSLIPLVVGRVNLKYFGADNIYADIFIDKNFIIGFGDYLFVKTSNFIVNISGSKIIIDNFLFSLSDKIKQQKVSIDGNYFYLEKYKKNKYLKSSADIAIKSDNSKSVINFNIDTKLPFMNHLDDYPPEISASVTNLHVDKFSNFINTLSGGKVREIGGVINLELHSDKEIMEQKQYLSNASIDNFYCDTSYLDKKFSYPHILVLKSLFLLSDDDLSVPSFSINSDKLNAKVLGKISKISTKNPLLNLNLKIIDQNAEDILELIPYSQSFDKLAKIGISTIKDALFSAKVNTDILIKNSVAEPDLYGDIILTDAYVTKPIKRAPKNAYIGIKFKGKQLDLKVNVPTNINQEVNVDGVIDVYGEQNADLHITSTNLIDLSEAERILMPVHKAFNFLLGPVPIMGFEGYGSIDLRVKGTRKNPHTFGWFKTNNATTFFDDIPDLILKNADSILTFDDFDTSFKLIKGTVNNKNVDISGDCNLAGKFEFNAKLQNQNASDLMRILKTSKMLEEFANTLQIVDNLSGQADLSMKIYGQLIDISKLNIGKNVHSTGVISLNNVSTVLNEYSAKINNISGSVGFDDFKYNLDLAAIISNSKLKLSGVINKNIASIIFKSDRIKLNEILKIVSLPSIAVISQNSGDSYIEIEGKYNGNISEFDVNNVKANGQIFFNNFIFNYTPLKMPVSVISGHINIKNNILELNRLYADIGTSRSVIGGKIYNLSKNPNLDLSIYSRLNQKLTDYLYNYSALYPIKIRGDVVLTSLISGSINNPIIKSNIRINKNSNIYYMGAALGEEDVPVNLSMNAAYENNKLNIRALTLDKIIQNAAKTYNVRQLNANGLIFLNNMDNIGFKNFKISTDTPTDTKIFNIVFGKPLIKDGKFTTDILLNGSMLKPVLRGTLNMDNVNIPSINAFITDLSLNFSNNTLIAKIDGNVFSNNFKININALNKLYPPFVVNEISLNLGNLDLDKAIKNINESSVEVSENTSPSIVNPVDFTNILIKKILISADNVIINKINAKMMLANGSLKNSKFSIDNFKFNLAQGQIEGSAGYDIPAKKYDFDLNVQNADADLLSESVFGVKGQIFGDLDGQMGLSCVGSNQAECFNTLTGHSIFQVRNGRMPKLGSLEYLLKAGNLVKSGITGLSLNSIIDLVVPLKTGNFDFINGSISINDGIADNIQIKTDGKDLNLFKTGEYNLTTSIADMYVFGRLSKKVSTPFGPVGNASLNTLFNTIPGVNLSDSTDKGLINGINKIPGLELSNKLYRVFAAEIHGDITGEDYVESFRWIE